MGKHLMASNKLAYSGHQTLPITPDGIPSGAPAAREALSDPELRDLRVLRGSIFCPCNPRVPRSGTCAGKIKSLRALPAIGFAFRRGGRVRGLCGEL